MYKYITQLILELVLASLLFFNVFVSKSLDTTLCLISLSVFLILTVLLKQFKKPVLRNKIDGLLVVLGTAIILMGAFYMLGFKTGFSNSYSSIFKNYISPIAWIKVFLIVGLSELIRYVVVNIECRKKFFNFSYQALMVIILFFVEMNIATKSYNFSSFNQLYEFFALIFVQSISKNLLSVDLLVIDDLGTENLNSMKFTELYKIINTRLLTGKTKTIISTNLDLRGLFKTYDERLASRFVGYYDIYKFYGDDIRLKK